MPLTGKSPDPNPCMLFIANIYFLVRALEISVFYSLRLGIRIYNAQSTLSELQAFHEALAPFSPSASDHLPQQLPQVSGLRTVTNGFPSVTSVLQHLVFKMSFHDVLFTAPSPSPGVDEKVIFIFQRGPLNYSTGLCIAYSLHLQPTG